MPDSFDHAREKQVTLIICYYQRYKSKYNIKNKLQQNCDQVFRVRIPLTQHDIYNMIGTRKVSIVT